MDRYATYQTATNHPILPRCRQPLALAPVCVRQREFVCCSVLQRVAVCHSVLQCVAVRCSALQCSTFCSVAGFHVHLHLYLCVRESVCVAAYCSVLQCVAVCCSVLPRVVVCCSVLHFACLPQAACTCHYMRTSKKVCVW